MTRTGIIQKSNKTEVTKQVKGTSNSKPISPLEKFVSGSGRNPSWARSVK